MTPPFPLTKREWARQKREHDYALRQHYGRIPKAERFLSYAAWRRFYSGEYLQLQRMAARDPGGNIVIN